MKLELYQPTQRAVTDRQPGRALPAITATTNLKRHFLFSHEAGNTE
jgi:hypothetical protein